MVANVQTNRKPLPGQPKEGLEKRLDRLERDVLRENRSWRRGLMVGLSSNPQIMRSTRPARLIVAIFAALAMTVFVNARAAFSQDADSGTSVDDSWERPGPVIDEDAETAEKVLEIPQVTCAKDGASVPCDGANADGDDDDSQAITAPSPGAPPTLDDDTQASAAPDPDWCTLNDYQNQEANGVPYGVYPYPITVVGTMNRPSVPASAYVPISSPLTQAARPPLNPGPWMLRPSMSAFSHPAGSPMMSFAFHH